MERFLVMVKGLNMKRLTIFIIFAFLAACGSGGDDVNELFNLPSEVVEVPPTNNLNITITKPSTNGYPTGYRKKVSGECGTTGILIEVLLNSVTNTYSACGADKTWSAIVDTSGASTGNLTIQARMDDDGVIGNPATVVVNKVSTACDSASARADTFANTSTTGVPPWEICTQLQLSNISSTNQNDDFTLMNDIDFGGGGFNSLGNTSGGFTGTFEGNNFEIANYSIYAPTTQFQGLFRETTGGTFQNIIFDTISISGRHYIGVLAGYVEPGTTTASNITISNATVEGMDSGNSGYVGGLFGSTRNGATTINISNINISNLDIPSQKDYSGGLIGYINSSNTVAIDTARVGSGDINGRSRVGGIIGGMSNTNTASNITLNKVYNQADVTCTNGSCGGLIGYAIANLTDVYNSGEVTRLGGSNIGGLIGYLRDGALSGSSAAATRESVTPPAIPTSTAPTVDSNGDPISCYNTGDVVAAGANNVGGLIGFAYRNSDTMQSCYNTGDVTGGLGYVGGLIGQAERMDIDDSYSTGNIIGEDDYIGGLVGYQQSLAPESTLTNSYSSGDVTSNGTSPTCLGGIAGRWRPNTAVSDIWYSGNITATAADDSSTSRYIGGIFGWAERDGSCTDCHSAGAINLAVTVRTLDHCFVGGVIGYSRHDVTQSSSTMNIDAQQHRQVGGLIGYDYRNTVTFSSATGSVDADSQAGGLIGFMNSNLNTVEDSYATGDVTTYVSTGSSYTGGLVGVGGGSIRRCYASGDVVANNSDYVGGLEGGRDADYNTEMINNFATGNVDAGTGNFVGGLSGRRRVYANNVMDNFATGTVRGGDYVGGLMGYVYRRAASAVKRNYAIGRVTRATGGSGPDTRFGYLFGSNNGNIDVIDPATNYYNSNFAPTDEATSLAIATPNTSNVNPLTSLQMTNTLNFVGFDFGTPVWEAPSGTLILPGHSAVYTYPVLDWVE